MDLNRLAEATGADDRSTVEILDLAYDPLAVTPGSLFFCIRGARRDGHDLAGDAVAAGDGTLHT